ncbi:4973_t:CDS:1, partial [Scutellospora calospora]
ESSNELIQMNNLTSKTKPLVIKPYTYTQEQKNLYLEYISIIQQSEPNHSIIIFKIYVPDPLELNPNSISNVRKVLEYIQNIAKIN